MRLRRIVGCTAWLVAATVIGAGASTHASDCVRVALHLDADLNEESSRESIASALRDVGRLYILGYGPFEKDPVAGADCIRVAANMDDTGSMAHLAGLYYLGLGVQQDFVLSHAWVSKAAILGDAVARRLRDQTAAALTPAQLEESRRIVKEWLDARR